MIMSPISNSKLHCCLVVLILFILIFLSLPLLLIYLANMRFEESQNQLTANVNRMASAAQAEAAFNAQPQQQQISPQFGNTTTNNSTTTTLANFGLPETRPFLALQIQPTTNCTEFALLSNLSLVEEDVQCPDATFPCALCPNICIEQRRNCDGNDDCPDRTDEKDCHDSNGAMGVIFQTIFRAKKLQQQQMAKPNSNPLAKPDSCTLQQFVNEQCPCVYTDPRVIICENLELIRIPNTLLSTVYKIRMGNNSISNIDNVEWPESLSSLVLINNRITHIGKSTFANVTQLSKLYLSHNEISYIDSEAFIDLPKLSSLQIEANKLETFNTSMLRYTPIITKLYLSENMIDLPNETDFSICQSLRELLLDHNRISIIKSHWFSNMKHLFWLSLTHNEIQVIEDKSFENNWELEELNLSFNKIKVINRLMFASRLNLQRLYLGGNPLQPLPIDAFSEIVHLKSLNLTHVDFDYIQRGTFSDLRQLEFIYFAKFRYCHYATHVRVCRPLTDGLSSVEELLVLPILKYAVWIVALVCSFGNVFVLIWRSISPHEDRTLSLFVKNLSIADLMMGIYLSVIGWQDWKFQHNFGRHAIEWMSSWTCTAIGFLAILSSELSVFILTIITIERYRSIISIKRFEEEEQKRRARIYVTLAWIFSFLIAFYPLIEWLLRNSDYYATNGLCLPLHIDQPFTNGWQYSAFIYLGINFSAVMIIIALYVRMYSMIMDGRHASRPVLFKAEKREDAILAIRFFFIVITDCLCWIPIVVIKLMALSNVTISSAIYGWLVVFIIPINSALNPIVYTLAAPTSLRAAVFRLFESICYKIDLLTSGGGSNYSSQSSSTQGSTNLDNSHSIIAGVASQKKRKNTGSNSTTTCDTFDTSIASHSAKVSVESATLINHQHSHLNNTTNTTTANNTTTPTTTYNNNNNNNNNTNTNTNTNHHHHHHLNQHYNKSLQRRQYSSVTGVTYNLTKQDSSIEDRCVGDIVGNVSKSSPSLNPPSMLMDDDEDNNSDYPSDISKFKLDTINGSVGDHNNGEDEDEFYHHDYLLSRGVRLANSGGGGGAAADAAAAGTKESKATKTLTTQRPPLVVATPAAAYDYMSTLEDNSIKHKLINDQTSIVNLGGALYHPYHHHHHHHHHHNAYSGSIIDCGDGQQMVTYRDRDRDRITRTRRSFAYDSLERRMSFDLRDAGATATTLNQNKGEEEEEKEKEVVSILASNKNNQTFHHLHRPYSRINDNNNDPQHYQIFEA